MAQIHTDAESDVDRQHRTAETKGEKQNEVIYHTGDDLIGIDESDGNGMLLKIQSRVVNNNGAPIRWPTDSWKRFQEPPEIFHSYLACGNDEDEGDNTREDLERD